MTKKLVKYGVAAKDFESAQEAHSHTYMKPDGSAPSTPLIFDINPFNEQVKNAKVILDLGCGTGRNLQWIMENTNALYIGIDPNDSMRQFFWDIQDKKWSQVGRVLLFKDFKDYRDMLIHDYNLDGVDLSADVVVCTFVFQHIGFRPPAGQMNVADITQEARSVSKPNAVWIMYEHDWEEPWMNQWMMECDIFPTVFERDYEGIPELVGRRPHHLLIWQDGSNDVD